KKLYALSGVFLIVLVISGLWAGLRPTKATNITDVSQALDLATTSGPTQMPMKQMVEESSLILIGTCLETKGEWVGRRLVTMATVLVEEPMKGDAAAGTQVKVALPGGIAPKGKFPLAMNYPGAPRMFQSEKDILFLTPESEIPDSYAVMGFNQGKFSVN